ncbi:aromatic amino acid ammonia-lyase [Rhodococcus sp. HNM0563]|uniref:aromatic amino acid lyase n=1 Tax=Rhodococcus sp. HNM0563 TaxID=2716339 RepID=UPI001980BEE6
MNVIELDGQSLTLDQVMAVAKGKDVRVVMTDDARKRVVGSDSMKREMIEAGAPIYGVTSGFGDSSAQQIPMRHVEELQKNLISFLATGTGPLATAEVSRATLIVRTNCLVRGWSGVREGLIDLLLACINNDVLPLIPEQGSVGASGDLVPLSYVGRMLTGHGDVMFQGSLTPAGEALNRIGCEPIVFDAKEGLAVVNGTSFMAAYAAIAISQARQLAYAATVCGALASQVLLGNPDHYGQFVVEQKPHPGSVRSAALMRSLLGTTSGAIGKTHERASIETTQTLDRPLQDRYSVRCVPQIIGVLLDTLDWASSWVTTEINSSNDNPLFDPENGTVWNGGNFYGGHVGLAMDALKTAVASVSDMLDRQLELIVDEKFNNGLTANLVPWMTDTDERRGLLHGFKGMQIAASALTAEALKLTMPATSFSRSTEAHNQDKVSMGTIAARDARTVIDLTRRVAAIHLIALSQAVDIRGVEVLSPATESYFRKLREVSPFVSEDRALDGDITAVAALIEAGAFDEGACGAE